MMLSPAPTRIELKHEDAKEVGVQKQRAKQRQQQQMQQMQQMRGGSALFPSPVAVATPAADAVRARLGLPPR